MKEVLEKYAVVSTVKVQWGDMDALQHVNNVVYVRWGETARIDYFRALGFFSSKGEKMKTGIILGFQSVKYIAPVTYPDTIHIGTKTEEIRDDRVVLKSFYYSEKSQKLMAIKTHEVILFDFKTQSKIPVPKELVLQINNLESI
ncbi:acyl-CoA thioester hydrolase [Flavobacterium gillisiae]|uniref:Acyl-CoA thioester hydrolase n=1 Tax=Flavobacterium gillisiae TaxID=150146 RepID=A0A1H4ASK2_9FLAO|nr:thioesterase family protein [Flavobacterium gillisiae]SEA38893.1 acyl-CoA thioester hydrolase [Flavobacterium gillisiae]